MRMRYAMSNGKPWFRLVMVMCLLFAGMANSGCVTTLGYLPDDIKPKDPTQPTYLEVVQWGTDLKDGYGSRASGNRNAIYGGALVAAAAASAIVGLATFSTTSGSTILGIGLGTGFLASAASIYSNDLKAQLYDRASSYMDKLLIRSRPRLKERQGVSVWTSKTLTDATAEKTTADQTVTKEDAALKTANDALAADKDNADKKNAAAAAKTSDDNAKAAQLLAQKRVQQAQTLSDFVKSSLVAEALYNLANEAYEKDKNDAKKEKDKDAKKLEWEEAKSSLKKFFDPETDEAQCLRKEIRAGIDKVTIHLEQLTPENLTAQLKLASQASKSTTPLMFTNKATDFSDLENLDNDTCPILGLVPAMF